MLIGIIPQKIYVLIFFSMIFCHIIDDYYLQGILAQMKQKSWWEDQKEYNEFYQYDYLIALLCHGYSWSFVVHVPILLASFYYHLDTVCYDFYISFWFLVIFQGVLHSIIDNYKANEKIINLVTDQTLHLFQIVASYVLLLSN